MDAKRKVILVAGQAFGMAAAVARLAAKMDELAVEKLAAGCSSEPLPPIDEACYAPDAMPLPVFYPPLEVEIRQHVASALKPQRVPYVGYTKSRQRRRHW